MIAIIMTMMIIMMIMIIMSMKHTYEYNITKVKKCESLKRSKDGMKVN